MLTNSSDQAFFEAFLPLSFIGKSGKAGYKHHFYGANELTAFSKAESDCKNKTIHLVVPATKSHPYFELKSTSKKGHVTVGEKKVNVSPDWLI